MSFILDSSTESIQYRTVRRISPGEELCIFYGHKLWFDPVEGATSVPSTSASESEVDDGWGGLGAMEGQEETSIPPFIKGNPEDILSEEDLPFAMVRPPPTEQTMKDIKTGVNCPSSSYRKYSDILILGLAQAWVVDIPDPRQTAALLKYVEIF